MDTIWIGSVKAVKSVLNGKPYYLVFNGFAFFELQDKLGTDFIDQLSTININNFKAFKTAFRVLSKQGELVRRSYNLDKCDFLLSSDISFAFGFSHMTAVMDAVMLGLKSEEKTKEDEELDLILLENQKKKV